MQAEASTAATAAVTPMTMGRRRLLSCSMSSKLTGELGGGVDGGDGGEKVTATVITLAEGVLVMVTPPATPLNQVFSISSIGVVLMTVAAVSAAARSVNSRWTSTLHPTADSALNSMLNQLLILGHTR